MEDYQIGYQALEDNLVDLIAEEQAKLGYRKESIRFYYPLKSLNHFFDCDKKADEMQKILEKFPEHMEKKYGRVSVSHEEERFCIMLSEQASEYVHNHKDKNEFIEKLVNLLAVHDTTMQQVIDLFKEQENDCVIEEIKNGEFDLLIRFPDAKDRYYYCFKDEGCHIIYHRFLPEDYKDFYFEEK